MMLPKIHNLLIYGIISLLCFVFVFFDIKNAIVVLLQKRHDEMQLSSTVEAAKNNLIKTMGEKQQFQVDTTLLDTATVLSDLDHIFTLQAIQINKIQLLKVKMINGVNILPVKVSAISQFSSLMKLLVSLINGPRPIMLNDFSFQRDQNGAVVAEMQFFIFGVKSATLQRSSAC